MRGVRIPDTKHLLHHGSPRSWIGSPVLFCSNRPRCRVYTGFRPHIFLSYVYMYIYAHKYSTQWSRMGLISYSALSYLFTLAHSCRYRSCPQFRGRSGIRKKKERTRFSTMLHLSIQPSSFADREKQDLGKTLLISGCKTQYSVTDTCTRKKILYVWQI